MTQTPSQSLEELPASVLTARSIVSELVTCGVTRFVYCPGSRNAPLAYALTSFEKAGLVSVHTMAEERGAGFWALGALRAPKESGPVGVVTTSGTAAAELLPAIAEAKHLGLPLVVVTADRPFELRGVGANQTMRQPRMYSDFVLSDCDLPALDPHPEPSSLGAVANQVRRLVARAIGHGGTQGPVHLNVSFREPLAPSSSKALDSWTPESGSPVLFADPTLTFWGGSAAWSQVVDGSKRTVLVAGNGPGERADSSMRALALHASSLEIPLIAEPSSGLCDLSTWLPHGPAVAEALEGVEQVVVIGKPTLSRQVAKLLEQDGITKIVVGNTTEWPDVSGSAQTVVAQLVPDDRERLSTEESLVRRGWLQYCRGVAAKFEAVLRAQARGLNHLAASRVIWHHSQRVQLWLGASNVIRAFDLAAPAPGPRRVYSNRGLAGIDGTIASALGLQAASNEPVRVVLGDVSFAYDLPSLPARPDGDQDIQLIVFDDGGGTIFRSLEHGDATDDQMYAKYFGVPQAMDVCAIAQACGWEAKEVNSIEELRTVVLAPIEGRSVIRVPLSDPTPLFAYAQETLRNA